MKRPPKLSAQQWALLQEIAATGVLYIKRGTSYHRTAKSLYRKGVAKIVEPDYSPFQMDGWAAIQSHPAPGAS